MLENPASRKEQLEKRLEQSRRLLKLAGDSTTAQRISQLIGELEDQQKLESER